MRFSPDIDRDLLRHLKDKGSVPPHEMIGALLSFGTPDQVLTYRVMKDVEAGRRAGWLSVARVAGGLLVVEASSDDEYWSWENNHEKTRNEDVAATWFPLAKIKGVGLRHPKAFRGPFRSSLDDVTVEGTWVIHIDGREAPLMFDRAPGENQDFAVVEDFCMTLVRDIAESS